MELNLNHVGAAGAASAALHDFNQQCLRILRCTARAMASSPGGLRFKAGTRPWLDGLSNTQPAPAGMAGRRGKAVLQAVGE